MAYSRPQLIALVQQAAEDIGVPAEIALAQAQRESGFNADARGRAGERGLMQPLPSTWREWMPGVSFDLAIDPAVNLQFWQKYYGYMLGLTNWDFRKALVGYNGGPGALTRPRQSSLDYAVAIMAAAGWNGSASQSVDTADGAPSVPAVSNETGGNLWPLAVVVLAAAIVFFWD